MNKLLMLMTAFNLLNMMLAAMATFSSSSSSPFESLSSSQGSLEMFEEALYQNDYKVPDDAIYQAISSEYASPLLFDILIGYGATVTESDLQFALSRRKPELLDSLLSSFIGQGFGDVDEVLQRLLEILMSRPDRLNDECLLVLMKRGLEITDRTFCSILDYGALDLLPTLTEEGYRIPDIAVLLAIDQASSRGLGPLRFLLQLGANPNATYYSISALEAAIQSPNLALELTRLLIEYGVEYSREMLMQGMEGRGCSSELVGLLYGPVETLSQSDRFALMVNGYC